MKICFKIIIIFALMSLLNSCCKELRFEKNETFWTDVYSKGDRLIFKSDSFLENGKMVSNSDTIFITDKTVFRPTGDCNLMVRNTDPEGCVIEYTYKHDSIISEPDLFVQHFKEEKGKSYPVLRVYNTEFSGNKVKDTSIVLNSIGVKLNDCFTFRGSKDSWGKFKLKTFVWSKKMGLVLFIGYNGEKFEFVKKIKKSL